MARLAISDLPSRQTETSVAPLHYNISTYIFVLLVKHR